jgi:hypothetical protein
MSWRKDILKDTKRQIFYDSIYTRYLEYTNSETGKRVVSRGQGREDCAI